MALPAFDTLKVANRLKSVGVPSAQAEAEAEVLSEIFEVNLKALATKEDLLATKEDLQRENGGRITARNVGYEVCADQMDCRAWHRTNRLVVYPEAPSHWRVIHRFFYSSGVSHSRAGRRYASSPC